MEQQQQRLRAPDLGRWLADQPSSVRALSLDCFDTIVWRRVAQPVDVFYALQQSSSWRRNGIRAAHRVKAEQRARARKHLLSGIAEVTIDEIYQALLPAASEAERAECIADELREEIAHAYLFAPVIDLIRQAGRQGLKVVVVSDTYWSRAQLSQLLAGLAGDDMLAHVRLHCSCEYGVSKAGGIWPHVLKAEKLQPHQIVHLGDNEMADAIAPGRFGLRSAQLVQHDEETSDVLQHYANAASQIMPDLRHERALPSFFHGLLGMWRADGLTLAQQIGYRSMGPIMYAFARYLEAGIQALEGQDRPVRVAFLMRDGYLPMRSFAALRPDVPVAPLQISRFCANAASFRGREDVVRLLAAGVDETSAAAVLRQMLFTEQESAAILSRVNAGGRFAQVLSRELLREDRLRTICTRSMAFRQRLYAHVRRHTGIGPGETLVLVDLGYSGTVQTRLKHLFRDDLQVQLHGLYLLASAAQPDMSDRQGLIDPSWADERMITALTSYIGLFEMMCAKDGPSSIDYTDEGETVFGRQGTKVQQSETAREIQEAAVTFVQDMAALPVVCRPKEPLHDLACQAAGELCRLTFFPQPQEVACLSAFEFDLNLGTDIVMSTADLMAGAQEYRREGFALMNREISQRRVSYPMEMRHLDLSLATTMLSAHRYSYGIPSRDMSHRQFTLPVLVADGHSHALQSCVATATFDGFYAVHLPYGSGFDISVLLGEVFEWVQFDAVQQVSLADASVQQDLVAGEHVIIDGAVAEAGGIHRLSPEAMLFVPRASGDAAMLRLVFRPLVTRPAA